MIGDEAHAASALAMKAGGYLATAGAAAITALWARKADVGRMIDTRWSSLTDAMDKRCKRAEDRCDQAEAAHERCEAQLAEVRRQVQVLMAGEIATYPAIVNPRPPK